MAGAEGRTDHKRKGLQRKSRSPAPLRGRARNWSGKPGSPGPRGALISLADPFRGPGECAPRVVQAPRLGVFFLVIFFSAAPVFPLDFQGPGDPETLAHSLAAAMSDEQALAQTFMLGWGGAEPSPLIMDWIRDRNIGG